MLEFVKETICIEESSPARPHYRVRLRANVRGHPDLLPGLLCDELVMTVCLPMDVGTDLKTIKLAAADRFAAIAAQIPNYQPTKQLADHQAEHARNASGSAQEDQHNGDDLPCKDHLPVVAERETD